MRRGRDGLALTAPERRGLLAHRSADEFTERCADAFEALAFGQLACLGARNDDRVAVGRKALALDRERLTQQPLDAVAVDGAADLARHREAEAGAGGELLGRS